MTASSDGPHNPEEAAYAAFALIEAILERLQLAHVLDDAAIRAIIKTAEARLANQPNNASGRAASFLRDAMLGEK